MYTLQPEKKSNGCVRILAVIGAITLLVVVAAFAVILFPFRPSSSANTTQKLVVYQVTTTRNTSGWPSCFGFDTTYELGSGTAQKRVNICDGARRTTVDQFTGSSGDFVYLSVQNDKYLARIGCSIYIDGKLVYQTHSEGQYVIASCSGSIP